MDPHELVPLEAGIFTAPRAIASRHYRRLPSRTCHRAPLKLCRLIALLITLPCLFIFVPLYLRYRVYSGQMYPMSMTDMRLIDSKISPIWCQQQVVKSNATFNAFVVPGLPELTDDLVPVSMTRELELEDDMKEYWGFYLLKGSTVTVSACVRWPGASLIMIKGYKHLQECAYIGDDSSEELDELLEANKLGLLSNTSLMEKLRELKKEDGKANDPGTMRRHKAGVSFHDPSYSGNATSPDVSMPTIDVTDHDPKELREILERLHAIRQAAKTESLKYYRPPSHLMSLPALHRHRDTNVDRDERRWLSFKDIDGNNSDQELNTTEPNKTITTQNQVENDDDSKTNETNASDHNFLDVDIAMNETYNTREEINAKENDIENEIKDEVNSKEIDYTENIETKITKEISAAQDPEEPNSKEVYEDVLKKLQALGDKGKRVLVRLHEAMGAPQLGLKTAKVTVSTSRNSGEELDHLQRVLVEAIDEENTKTQRQQKRREATEDARVKREMMLGQIELQKQLNEDDEARDYAAEEDLQPDGYAEHHQQLNETTAIDMSNSEFWSSFSSSEEALLECEGLILNLPLTPHHKCTEDGSVDDTFAAAKANALTYRVPANGYYFFVFNSENEVQVNYIRARFELQKTRYDVARTALRECRNSTERCNLTLDLFSSQKVVLEVPFRDNDSLWNEQFVIISECEPRTSVYMVCVLAVPVLILILAFQ